MNELTPYEHRSLERYHRAQEAKYARDSLIVGLAGLLVYSFGRRQRWW